ncbi:Prp18 [Xylariomycetidae sp. FL2044]|nr:Prp18 [Xylariomycetidae sp. FL2044]
MDFASLMSKEIAKAKPSSGGSNDASSNVSAQKKKYTKRAEAEAAREAAYQAEQRQLEERRAARAAEKRKRDEEAAEEAQLREDKRRRLEEDLRRRREEQAAADERARRKRLGLPEQHSDKEASADASDNNNNNATTDGEEDIPDSELIERLRGLGEPATVFGETHRGRLKRYRRLTRAAAMTTSGGPIPTTLRLVDERDMKVDAAAVPKDRAGRAYLFRQLASYFSMVLGEWERALAREQQEKKERTGMTMTTDTDTFAGKAAVNAMVSSRANMVPLFRKFEKGELDDDILVPVVEIVQAAQERRYVDANDGYLRLSIGKAAWPIGVTMVGIHERSAREKLHNGERGHVMGDEVTRKYLQSIKRCLTFAQVRWPPEDLRQLMG